MKRKQPNDLFWAVLGILNLLAVCYPLNLWLEADDELGRLVANRRSDWSRLAAGNFGHGDYCVCLYALKPGRPRNPGPSVKLPAMPVTQEHLGSGGAETAAGEATWRFCLSHSANCPRTA